MSLTKLIVRKKIGDEIVLDKGLAVELIPDAAYLDIVRYPSGELVLYTKRVDFYFRPLKFLGNRSNELEKVDFRDWRIQQIQLDVLSKALAEIADWPRLVNLFDRFPVRPRGMELVESHCFPRLRR